MNIREALPEDIDTIIRFIKDLAEYEKLSHLVTLDRNELQKHIFEYNHAHVLIGEIEQKPAGFALYFLNFSTFLGKPGIYLEDLYVDPTFRGHGLGKSLLQELCKIAKEKNYGRVEWSCLDWNEPSIKFYNSLGAKQMDEWLMFRVTEENFDSVITN